MVRVEDETTQILAELQGLIANPTDAGAEALFAPSFCAVSKGEVFSLDTPTEQLLFLNALRKVAVQYEVQRVERRLLEARAEDETTLHSIHSSTWYNETEVVTAPFSTLLTHKQLDGRFKIARMQISSLAPCSMARDLAAYKTADGQQEHLDLVQHQFELISQAYLNNSFEEFRKAVSMPLVLQWDNHAQVFDTEDGLRERFRFITYDLRRRSVTEVFRRVKSVQITGDNQLFATCTTYLLSGQVLASDSVTNSMWFKKDAEGQWALAGMLNPRLPPITLGSNAERDDHTHGSLTD